MPKTRISYVCQECGYDSPAYLGKCPECGSWSSFKEISILSNKTSLSAIKEETIQPRELKEISFSETSRLDTNFQEFNTVLGGGLVAGSAILLAGDPGIGKSTLLLQLCLNLAKKKKKVLYASGEESLEQIKMRAKRILQDNDEPDNLFLISLTDVDILLKQIEKLKPEICVVDSIQTMQSVNVSGLAGSVAQIRYSALRLIRAAKEYNIPIIVVGHVTKEGMIAGPMILSHMVDTVLFLEGEKQTTVRVLRSFKNRFGPVDEVGVFQMQDNGLSDISDPEQLFLTKNRELVPGSILVVTLEGSRAFLVELQALAVYSRLAMPRRVVSGVDQRRVELLLAVLQKHVRLPVENMDIFVNVAGGIRLSDPSIDLGICLAIFSSFKNIALPKTVGIAEVGLLGELRSVPNLEKRIREAEKLGYDNIISVKSHKFLDQVIREIDNTSNSNRTALGEEKNIKEN